MTHATSSGSGVLVSVIITTYNSEQSIQRALNSVLNQQGLGVDFQVELIVIDDNSNDRTIELLKNYEVDLVKLATNSGGPNKGRNLGLDKAKGDFICIMDHDDEWKPDKIKSQLKWSHLAPLITSGYSLHNSQTGKISYRVTKSEIEAEYKLFAKNESFLKKLSKSKNAQITYIGGIMFHHKLRNIKFEEKTGKIDYDWLLSLLKGNNSVEILRSLFIRYVDEKNLSLDENYRLSDLEYSLKTLESYQSEFPAEVEKARKRINGTLARYYYVTNKMNLSRRYFRKAGLSMKTVLYYLTTYSGHKIVKRFFNVFG